MFIIVTEARTKKGKKLERKFEVPDRIQLMLRKKEVRQKMRKNCFLLPEERKFPICNPLTGKIDCRLVKAAMSRAAGFNRAKKKYPSVFRRAQEIYNKRCKVKQETALTYDALIESVFIEYINDEITQALLPIFTESELLEDFTTYLEQELATEQVKGQGVREFPKYLEDWLKDRNEIPASYFLLPEEKKFPVKGPNGKYDCRLILHARIRAKQFNYPDVARKAEQLWQKYCQRKSK